MTVPRRCKGGWGVRARQLVGAGWLALAGATGAASAQTAVPASLPASAPAAAGGVGVAPLPPAQLFYQRPTLESTALSPSGRWLAMSTRGSGPRTVLVVFDLQAWKPLATVASFSDADVSEFHWVNDERLVLNVIDHQRGGGDQRLGAGLFSVKRDGREFRQLVQTQWQWISNERRLGVEPLSPAHDLLFVPGVTGDEVVVGEYRYTEAGEPDGIIAKRLNVVTGRASNLSAGIPSDVVRWWFDPDGAPKAVLTQKQGRSAVHWREGGPGAGRPTWRVLTEGESFNLSFAPRFVDAAGVLYVTTNSGREGAAELRRFNFATGKPEPEALVSTPGFDFAGRLVTESGGGRALGVHVLTDAQTTVWFDSTLKAVQAEADRRLPGHVNSLECRPCSGPDTTVVVHSWSDTDPGQIWVHWPAKQQWRPVGNARSGIDPQRMGTTDFERFRARDGLEIPVWITRPAGPKAGPRPAVVLVHGGPWVRGRSWRWNDDAQFLASRGYVVIEPEFRGSSGYGQRLFRAGWKEWGQAMQDDVADALAWAVKRGDADPKRACVAGASYGGYAALMGLVRHGDLYRCAVAWVAVTDPRLLYTWRRDSDLDADWREFGLPRLVGDPTQDAAMLDAVSPVLHAERMRAPVLLAFGGLDRRVPLVHGTRMRDALRAVGREPSYVVYQDEGHGWLKLENQIDFATRMERFLAEHLK